MAALNIPIPPWLHGPGDVGQHYLSGFHAGAAISMERDRLAAQRQHSAEQVALAQQRLQQEAQQRQQVLEQQAHLRREALNQEMLKSQQELLVKKSYEDSLIGLREQGLKQAATKIQLASDTAARRFAAQRAMASQMQGGASFEDALFSNPDLLTHGVTEALIRGRQSQKEYGEPTFVDVPGVPGTKYVYRKGSTGGHVVTMKPDAADQRQRSEARKALPRMIRDLGDLQPGSDAYEFQKRQIQDAQKLLTSPPVHSAAQAVPIPDQEAIPAEEGGDTEPDAGETDMGGAEPPAQPSWDEGTVLTHKDGSRWIMQSGKLLPYEEEE